ncbi:helix-turn-helix domain-containing protein [Elizabethkingia anophelis]|uniref:helix-turn-helix domain-containing protein n=1 Tax=Elizabethkingia anophelis TaxID=1117645 RepID=UPI00099B15B4|nr:helix-turn-helix domain-containing protein [Elizabethkingia anophelis]MCT3719840.1 helix-turn-helix domain-containing protein [Elizabethkingia anophelis]MCT3723350.1 helix-turn-helix domain-containing protein [Elizabethkingia anophelis]MCT3755223.1 helix-turn-helix domain-containing protein [Elizabethkingia anophelis]MCT3776488.1 helix-turn-helix domain-containing protein [Elizabethkingia anophelis]MCT3783601.1 helix-turn-helix domain-containing protein [Elizabethkingia anophelis]
MKTIVQKLREEQNLTQTELAEKSGVSLRTVQRIEAGNILKGFTLKALAGALEVDPEDLVVKKDEALNVDRAKRINLSALLGLFIPLGGIIFPLILTYKTKDTKNRELGKSIVSVQIVLAFIVSVSMIISPFIQKALSVKFPIFIIPLVTLICLKLFVVIHNGVSLNKNGDIFIRLKTSFL